MAHLLGVFAILCIFVAPLWLIICYTTQHQHAQSLMRDDEKILSDL